MTPLLIKYGNIVPTTTTGHRLRYHLSLVWLVRPSGYIVNLSDFYSYRLIGKLTVFFTGSGVQIVQTQRGMFHLRHLAFSAHLKVGITLAKVAVLRINLNIDGTPVTSRTHTHPSHSETSRLLTSSLSLGVPVPRSTQCIRVA